MELARRVAGSFRPGDEDLKAELFKRLAEIKAKELSAIQNWQAYLAQSLYNAAKNFIRHEDVLRRRARFLSLGDEQVEGGPACPEPRLIALEDSIEPRVRLAKVWAALTPERRELAQLLLEEEGSVSAVAKRLGRHRKTVEYWIRQLRTALKEHGLEYPQIVETCSLTELFCHIRRFRDQSSRLLLGRLHSFTMPLRIQTG